MKYNYRGHLNIIIYNTQLKYNQVSSKSIVHSFVYKRHLQSNTMFLSFLRGCLLITRFDLISYFRLAYKFADMSLLKLIRLFDII